MKAITVRQPWASLLVGGQKQYECRSWPLRQLGWYVIHAGAKRNHLHLCTHEHYYDALCELDVEELPLMALIGMVRFDSCLAVETIRDELSDAEIAFGDFDEGYAWGVADCVQFRSPIQCKGSLNLWGIPEGFAHRIKTEMWSVHGIALPNEGPTR